MLNEFCLGKTIQHLGQAYVMHGEVSQGYPNHLLGVIGHLAKASDECIGASMDLAEKIRQYRLLIHQNVLAIDNIDIPYFDLYRDTKDLIAEKGCGSINSNQLFTMQNDNVVRKFCLDCTIKHISLAYIMHIDVLQGNVDHLLGVIGHLAEASEECMGISIELSGKIYQYMIRIQNNILSIKDVDIPYFDLYNDVVLLIKEKGCGNCTKAKDSFKERLEKERDAKNH